MRMSYTLAAAAAATGLNITTIVRAIEDGVIAGFRDEHGEWRVEPDELYHLQSSMAELDYAEEPTRHSATAEVEALGAQIEALLRQAARRLRQQLDDVRADHDAGYEHIPADELAYADRHERTR